MLRACLAIGLLVSPTLPMRPAAAQPTIHQGAISYPDFAGRDRRFARFRTRIRQQIAEGPNFAGRFAVIEIGCGTGCRHVFVANVATGQVFDFPFSAFDSLSLTYSVTSNVVNAVWITGYRCDAAELTWTGTAFNPVRRRVLGTLDMCR